jgi:D-alanine transaminase
MKNILAVYNGSFDSLDKIKVSPLSRAYTFSDSVYEVIPFYNSNIIAFDDHIARLKKVVMLCHFQQEF